MTKATLDHRNHCSCPRITPDLYARITAAFGQYGEAYCREILRTVTGSRDPATLRPHPLAARKARIYAKVSPPDAAGHQHWTGKMPKWGWPRPMLDGVTRDVPTWLWLWADSDHFVDWPGNVPLRRLCHDVQCVAPDHHTSPKVAPLPLSQNSAALEAWEALHPRPHDPRSIRWLRGPETGYMGERCLAGHQIKVYSTRPRKSYCAQCADQMRTWQSERKAEIARIESRATGLPPRVPNEPQLPPYYADVAPLMPPVPEGPLLSDILASWSPEDFEPHAQG